MNFCGVIICLLTWFGTFSIVTCTSKRTIYTLFTQPKSWNEAKAICESQFGQLLKAEHQSDLDEVSNLDVYHWSNALDGMLTTGKVWNGLHKPFTNSTLEYQDCEVMGPAVSLAATDLGGECGAFQGSNFDLVLTNCEDPHTFICERFEGDCWFEPFTDVIPIWVDVGHLLPLGTDATGCAFECRNTTNSSSECWGFQFDPDGNIYGCHLYFMSDGFAQTNGGTSASVFHMVPSNLVFMNNTILYVRRCFEGVIDSVVYSQFVNPATSPETVCTSQTFAGDDADAEICFCSTSDQPPIPEPISDEAKAEEYVRELTIDTANTSAALRKLISAEDNRPSAVSIGFLGVAMMVAVFGGLFLLDLGTLISEFKKIFTKSGSSATTEAAESNTTEPPESEC